MLYRTYPLSFHYFHHQHNINILTRHPVKWKMFYIIQESVWVCLCFSVPIVILFSGRSSDLNITDLFINAIMKQDLSVADRFFLDSDQSQAAWVYLTRAAGRRACVDWHKVAPWASAVSVGCRVDIKGSCSWCYLGLQAERTRARTACRLYKTFHIARKKSMFGK